MEDLPVTRSLLELGLWRHSLHLHAEGVLNGTIQRWDQSWKQKALGEKFPVWPRGSHTKVVHNLSFEVYFFCTSSGEGRKKK